MGQKLPCVERLITQERIQKYAHASGDFNPIHIDERFAATTPFGRTIAHGMLILAVVSEMMTVAFDMGWLEGGRLKVRFKAPVYPGGVVTTFGEVTGVREIDGAKYAICSVGCRNHKGEEVIVGEARART